MKKIPNLPASITEDLQIFNHLLNRNIKMYTDKDGYKLCKINGKMHKVHRLIAKAYYGDSDLLVNHIDGVKDNNNPANLEFVTHKENCVHAFKNNLLNMKPVQMENEKRKVFNTDDIKFIRSSFGVTHNYSSLSKMYNVSRGVIFQIIKNKTYKEIN